MIAKSASPRLTILLSAVVAIGIFVLDLNIELGVAAAVPYVAVIWLVHGCRSDAGVWLAACCCTLLTLIGWLYSPEGGVVWKVIANRLLALVVIWMTAAQCVGNGRLERAQIGLNQQLEQRIRERTLDLQETNAALELRNSELQQYTYVVSHDLQSPLRTVSGFAQILQTDYAGQLDEEAEEHIQRIVDGTTRMQQLISDLLVWSQLESEVTDRRRIVSMNDVIDSAIADLHAELSACEGSITRDDLPQVLGDRPQLARLVSNLLGNGLKYQGSEPPVLHVSAESNETFYEFRFQDNGIGIEPMFHESIFEVFRRLHTEQEYSGTGIGLAICQRVVLHHQGSIRVESTPGQGSCFIVRLPNDSADVAVQRQQDAAAS